MCPEWTSAWAKKTGVDAVERPLVRVSRARFAPNNALTAAQVIEELIRLAKDIRAARARGERRASVTKKSPFTMRSPKTRARAK